MMKTFLVLLLVPLTTSAFTPLQRNHQQPECLQTTKWWSTSVEAVQQTGVGLAMMAVLLLNADAALAAKAKDISGQDFSGQDLGGKDFTGVIAKGTNFHNANLQGSVFSSASLEKADFSGADLRGATFVDAALDGASFKNAQAQKAIFSRSILDAGDLENIDLTQSLWPSTLRVMICDMDELKGKNPVTGADSRDSIKCTEINYKS
jgi:uncharacterized protein YjbI with pentapeptide repeats